MKKWLTRGIAILAAVELIYLGVINLALNLDYTQERINQARPEKFAVSWERAWSWYPCRVHAEGISANGQSASQQWQVEAPSASATVALLPLLRHRVKIRNLDTVDLQYYQRPRAKKGKDYSAVHTFFPVITNRDPGETLATPPLSGQPDPTRSVTKSKPGKKPWHISIRNARARGNHRIWLYQVQGKLSGSLQTNLSYQTRGGPLALSKGRMHLTLENLVINADREVIENGRFEGTLELAPFVTREHKGLKKLAFLTTDLDVQTRTDSLAFLNFYLGDTYGIRIDGKGQVKGRLHLKQGALQPETDLRVDADQMKMDLHAYRVAGSGRVNLRVAAADPDVTRLAIEFAGLRAFHDADPTPLLTGEGLALTGRASTIFLPDAGSGEPRATYLAVDIPSLVVPDLASYQRFLPPRMAVKLLGGQGELKGHSQVTPEGFDFTVNLVSAAAEVGLKDYRFTSDLDIALIAHCPSIARAAVDISGTHFKLNETQVSSRETGRSDPWHASLSVVKGAARLDLEQELTRDAGFKKVWEIVQGRDMDALLHSGRGELALRGEISDLRWLNLLLKNPYNMTIEGGGKITADVKIDAGWLAPGTLLKVHPNELAVHVLEYEAKGAGEVTLAVDKGGPHPDIRLNANVREAFFKRNGEKEAFIENVALELQALGYGMSYAGAGKDVELDLRIPSATVRDMAVYNRYLPEKSPFAILGGAADLTADIHLTPASAGGLVRLEAQGLRGRADDQDITADLSLDIEIADGVPQDMDFDISGSSLLLDHVKISGEEEKFDRSDWYARLSLDKGRAIWKDPTLIEITAGVQMKDTRPMVAMLANHRGKHGWLGNMLTVEDIRGEARLSLARKQMVIPYAYVASDDIDVGAKGRVNEQSRHGVFYVRYKKLDGILRINGEDRNFDIFGAREKFEEYTPVPNP